MDSRVVRPAPSFSLLSVVVFLLIAGTAAGLFWTALSLDQVARALPDDPERALSWRPDDAAALTARADALADYGDFQTAEALARQAIRRDPLSLEALSLLSLLAEWSGDQARADTFLRLAAARSPRHIDIQSRHVLLLLRAGDLSGALNAMDGMLRSRKAPNADLLTAMTQFAAEPEMHPPLIAVLAQAPVWRTSFFQRLVDDDPDTVAVLFAGLAGTKAPATREERLLLVTALIKADAYEQARQVWYAGADPEMGLLVNGDFARDPNGSPFDWALQRQRNVDLRLGPDADAPSGRALQISFARARVGAPHVIQILLLDPGSYRLTGRVKAAAIQTERGLVWKVRCLPGRKPVGQTKKVKGTLPWTPFAMTFTVPPEGCQAQELSLSLDATAMLDRDITGNIWFSDMSICREQGQD